MAASCMLRLVPWKVDARSSIWTSQKVAPGEFNPMGARIRLISLKQNARSSIRVGNTGSSNWVSRKDKAEAVTPNIILAGFSSDESVVLCPSSSSPSRTSPWLMLPPALGENLKRVHNFYSLAENKVLSVDNRSFAKEEELELERLVEDSTVVGSSHGWLALYNECSDELFLYNPLTRRHVKLPLLTNKLRIPIVYSRTCFLVTKLVISCSPDEEDCRAMMTYTPENRLAFCCPGRSDEWTPIGDPFLTLDDHSFAREYEDFVYSTTQKLFFCTTTYGDLEAWDLGDPHSPRMTPMVLSADRNNYPWAARSVEELNLKKLCDSKKFLVVADQTNELFLVRRFVINQLHAGHFLYKYGSGLDYDTYPPYRTNGFDVHKIDREKGELRYMDGYLDGLAMFIGSNHSFAVCASEFPELKPNSIYFTDVFSPPYWNDGAYGGHDIGIFNYEDGTISPCYYPIDKESITRIEPSPIWFTPSQPAALGSPISH